MCLKAGCCFWFLSAGFFSCACRCCLTQSSLLREQPSRTWRTRTECLLVETTLQRDRKLSVLCVLSMNTGCPKKKSSQPIPGHQNFLNWLVLLPAVVCNEQEGETKLRSRILLTLSDAARKDRWGWEDQMHMLQDIGLFQFSADLVNRWFWLSVKSFSRFYCCYLLLKANLQCCRNWLPS